MILSELTLVILGLNAATDSGEYVHVSVDKVSSHVDAKTIFDFLDANVPQFQSNISANAKADLTEELYRLRNAAVASEFGIYNQGLCWLLALVNELVQEGLTAGGWTLGYEPR